MEKIRTATIMKCKADHEKIRLRRICGEADMELYENEINRKYEMNWIRAKIRTMEIRGSHDILLLLLLLLWLFSTSGDKSRLINNILLELYYVDHELKVNIPRYILIFRYRLWTMEYYEICFWILT